MQNLRNVKHQTLDLPDTHLAAATFDLTDDSLICAFGPTKTDTLLSLKHLRSDNQLVSIAAWDAVCPRPNLQHDSVISIHHFSDDQSIVLVLAGGDLVLVREVTDGQGAVEIVGSVDDGIAAAAWSPDEDLLLLATCSNTLLWMTRQFDNTATATLSAEDLKISNHVSVGWGKVETQFKGRGARALRDPTIPEHVDIGTLSRHDAGRVTITWRGDGQFVAINSILDTRRVIRVFTREGKLESVSEAVDNMEDAVAWKPSGQIIASVQRLQERVQVIFFEKNGLRHGEFDLRLTTDQFTAAPIMLSWNADSTVLAVSIGDKVQLWTSSNYHWYLKQEINSRQIVWHPEKPLLLATLEEQRLHTLRYVSSYSNGSTSAPHDVGLIAVIDGKQLAVTPLKAANIPPPMAYDTLDLPSVAVAFASANDTLAVLHHDAVSIFDHDYIGRPAKKARLSEVRKLPTSLRSPRHLEFSGSGSLCVAGQDEFGNSMLVQWQDEHPETTHPSTTIVSLLKSVGEEDLLLINEQGHFHTVSGSSASQHHAIPPSCAEAQIWDNGQCSISFGRTASGQLHICSDFQQTKIAGCTSFITTSTYLAFTTSQHLLKFVHLHDGLLDIPLDEPEKDERCRSIERGAKIVTIMPSIFALVLQMPRGNLETIYPRALVLAGIRQNLLSRHYKKAFMICRSQRVDMNILYDYAPDAFLEDVDLFIKQLDKIEYIDLFLSSLTEEDVTKTLYRDTTAKVTAEIETIFRSPPHRKVNKVCDAFLRVLDRLGAVYLQSIITAHVSKNPPDLEAGLRLVSQLRQQGDNVRTEQAVDHICFLCDVNRLYDTALGLYDLEVTVLVAQQSQKDPREYLPYVQSLRDVSQHRRMFIIDNDLKRYGKALSSLHALNEFEELLKYVDRHEMYAEALELYKHDTSRLHKLTRLHADFLSSRNRYNDAGVAYEFVGDFQAAYQAYRSANMWRETLVMAALVPVQQEEMDEIAQALSDSLCESKEFACAAIIHLDYLGDLPGAVKLQCKAYNFAEAMRLAVSRGSKQLLELVVDPGLVECSGLMTEMLAEMKSQLQAQIPRLRELRKKKIEEPMAYLDAGENDNADFPDNLSVAPTDASTSGGTFMTRYTNRSTGTLATNATRRTSKGRRREERKRARGKKGTVYEEEYLVNSITRLVQRLNETGADIAHLVQSLMRRAMRERAVAVEKAMLEVEQLCRDHMAEVYETTTVAAEVKDAEMDQSRPAGGQGVLWDSLNNIQTKLDTPVLKSFARLSLLSS